MLHKFEEYTSLSKIVKCFIILIAYENIKNIMRTSFMEVCIVIITVLDCLLSFFIYNKRFVKQSNLDILPSEARYLIFTT